MRCRALRIRRIGSFRKLAVLALILAASMLLSACASTGGSVDPGQWGYDCCVTYNALGGVINSREVRETYYMENSYVFEPSGSSNMLVEPVRDGYMLAGWYTAKEDVANADGTTSYRFKSEDRWDFALDRVQGDMTLYARWIPRGRVSYVNADTGETIFTKNITADSPVQALSSAVLGLSAPKNASLLGYFADPECTVPYDFSAYVHSELVPDNAALYAALAGAFPQYFAPYTYVEPTEEAGDTIIDTSYLFLEKLGWQLTDTSEAALSEIAARKDAIIEESIQAYATNTASKVVYMKFVDGNYILVSSKEDFKSGGKYMISDTDALGNPINGYVLAADVDLSGVTFSVSERFSGTISGNGYTLSNLTLSAVSKKVDNDKQKLLALAEVMDGASINDLTFQNVTIKCAVKSGIPVTAAILACEGNNVKLSNIHIDGLTIDTGKGDDGNAKYLVGDLFAKATNCAPDAASTGLLTELTSGSARTNLVLAVPQEPVLPEEGAETPAVNP